MIIFFFNCFVRKLKQAKNTSKLRLPFCSPRKFCWTIEGCCHKVLGTVCSRVSQYRKTSKGALFVLLEVSIFSGAAILSGAKILANHKRIPQEDVENFFSATKISWGVSFGVLECFWYQWSVSRFFIKCFCRTVLKCFLGEPFWVSESFWYRKILCITVFYVENFLFHSTASFREEIFWYLWVLAWTWRKLHSNASK